MGVFNCTTFYASIQNQFYYFLTCCEAFFTVDTNCNRNVKFSTFIFHFNRFIHSFIAPKDNMKFDLKSQRIEDRENFSQKIHISLWIFVCIFCWRPTYMWSLINITKNAFEENSHEVVGLDGCCFLGKTFISIIMCNIYAMLVLKHLYQFAFTQLLCRESNKNMTLKMNRSKHEHSTYDLKP